jgi:hypothetical protein
MSLIVATGYDHLAGGWQGPLEIDVAHGPAPVRVPATAT